MKGKRRLHHESLESRQLLAANCVPLPAATEAEAVLSTSSVAEGESLSIRSGGFSAAGFAEYALPNFGLFNLGYGPDLVQEHGNRLFVVDQHPFDGEGALLVVYERTNDGSLEVAHEIEVDSHVDRMIVHGDQVVLINSANRWLYLPAIASALPNGLPEDHGVLGKDPPPPPLNLAVTTATIVTLGEQVETAHHEFDGIVHQVHHDGDRLVVLTSKAGDDVVIAIFPPPEIHGLLQTFKITNDGLEQTASLEVPLFGTTAVHGDTLLMARAVHSDANTAGGNTVTSEDGAILPFDTRVVVTQYHLGEEITEVVELSPADGYIYQLHLSQDGQTAVVVSSEFRPDGQQRSNVSIFDLGGDQMQLFENLSVPGVAIATYDDYVLLSDYQGHLFVVDTNTSIDIAAENRIRMIEISERLRLHHDAIRLSGDRVVIMAHRPAPVDDDLPPPDGSDIGPDGVPIDAAGLIAPWRENVETILLTISLGEARIVADSHLGEGNRLIGPHRFVAIDAQNNRFGFFMTEISAAEDRGERFVFGHLAEDGEFVRDGSIRVGDWLEIDADPDRLIARESDRLIEYRWDNVDDPIITPLGEPDPPIEAVDDEYRLFDDGEDHLLNVLANDVIHRPFGRGAEIVELIGAPDGAEIVGGQMVRIPAGALEGKEALRFEYVISDGESTSSAVVEITVDSISDEEVEALVQRVRQQAAEDFGVPVEEVNITSVERLFDQPLPIVLPDRPDAPLDLSPGILVTLTVPNATALYAASLDGQIIQVFTSTPDILVELRLQAVNDAGEEIVEVAEGQEFWIEFVGEDLRRFGKGVYAAFFDLIVPTEHLVLTGEVEYGEGFVSIEQGSISESEVDDVGAISNRVDPPNEEVQRILRIRAKAVGAGEVTLRPDDADERGTETLLRGRQTEVPDNQVRMAPLTLRIVDPAQTNPLDADGNGVLSAADALVVINFLHRYGSVALEELADRVAGAGIAGEVATDQEMESMRRLDTNRNGEITALDALVVINRLTSDTLVADLEEPSEDETVAKVVEQPPSQLF